MSLSRTLRIGALGALALGFTLATAPGCSSSDDHTTHTGGAGGSTGGAGGSTGGAGGSTGGSGGGTGGMGGGGAVTPPFMAVNPCGAESDYMKVTTISALPTLKYSPACIQVKKGGMITFMMDFTLHPLKKSTMRGNTTANPIMDTAAGTSTSVTFPASGFYGYFCSIHGNDATGANMSGVIWVTD